MQTGNRQALERYRLADRAAFERHCRQKDALVATQYPNHFVLHHRDCRFMQNLLRDSNVELKDWPQYGLHEKDFPTFRGVAKAAGMEVTFNCHSRDCKHGLKVILG